MRFAYRRGLPVLAAFAAAIGSNGILGDFTTDTVAPTDGGSDALIADAQNDSLASDAPDGQGGLPKLTCDGFVSANPFVIDRLSGAPATQRAYDRPIYVFRVNANMT